MAKTANLYVRIEPQVKEQAENILSALGIPVSSAINMFYKQIILQNGLPFELKLPEHPNDLSKMTKEEFDAEMEKGYKDYLEGKGKPIDEAFDELYREWGVKV